MLNKYLSCVLNTTNNTTRNEDGLTLIEVAIGLIVIGLIALPLMQAYKIELIQESRNRTRGSLANTESAINQFYGGGNFDYPCPASFTLQESDPDFGASGDCAVLANIKLCTSPLWPATEGICKTDNTTDAVIIGAVPFSTLKIPQEHALDFWGNKIIYAVTFEQTEETTFLANNGTIRVEAVDNPGAIQIRIENGTAPTLADDGVPNEKTANVDFFLFSTGLTGVGGYTKDGILIQACGGAATGWEHENCDFDDIFFYDQNPIDDASSAFSEVPGFNFFDDMTRAQDSLPEQIWFPHPTYNPYLLTMSTRIGIGTASPQATIEVVGNIRTDGRLQSDQICDSIGNDCFDPELITGTMDAMKCDPSGDNMAGTQAVMRIADSQVYCNSPVYGTTDENGNPIPLPQQGEPIDGIALQVDTSVLSGNSGNPDGSCDPGELISGINASGEIICTIPIP
ncbi:MAG: hypothetical protein COA45_05605 [Zetaproteobacteria bacterium]|nr:MAG: hypothetical protein COA45_05605 [Zetaproteobacteria bacterium]